MSTAIRKVNTLILMSVLLISIAGTVMSFGTSASGVPESVAVPIASAGSLADEDYAADPTGQSVKQNKKLELGRTAKLDLINPIDWSLDVKGKNLLTVQIPLDLDLNLGMTFPVNASIAYDPYTVHNGTSFDYVMSLDNKGCTPYATVGVDMNFDLSKLNFQMGELPGLNFGVEFDAITYSDSWDIPFYGINTKMGNWISYDIVDRYYTLDKLLSLVGLPAVSEYGIKGGVGVNVQYNLYSYVTATASYNTGISSGATDFRWDQYGDKTFEVPVDSAMKHGEYLSVTVGNWTYHIRHDVTFSVWADIGLSVVGIDLFDETFKYAYTLGLGELKFPERSAFTFESKPQVLAGESKKNVDASWTALGIDWSALGGGDFTAFNNVIDIPQNDELAKWFTDMNVDVGFNAGLNVEFPYNINSYYNARKAVAGNTLPYNVITNSFESTESPNIGYNLGGYIDLSKVSILGKGLDKYSFSTSGAIFTADGFKTPFGTDVFEQEITSLIKLDTASNMLNDKIAEMCYGVNPDIQFRAWLALKITGQMTGQVSIPLADNTARASLSGPTNFVWDEQFDTQTAQVVIPSNAPTGSGFYIQYSNMVYTIKVVPGLKLGVSVLGGIIGFDYTFFLPASVGEVLTQTFNTDMDFTDYVEVETVNFETSDFTVNPASVPNEVYDTDADLTGSFVITNTGSQTDSYNIELDTTNLPAGTTASGFGVVNLAAGASQTVNYYVYLGEKAHAEDYLMNDLVFDVSSVSTPSLFSKIGQKIELVPDPLLVSSQIIAESTVEVVPGVGTSVPITVINDGKLAASYSVSLTGTDANVGALSSTSFYLLPGQSKELSFDISVPRVPSATGSKDMTLQVSAGSKSWSQGIKYIVMPFVDDQISVNKYIAPQSVNLGQDATFQFVLNNQGNTQQTYNVSVVSAVGYDLDGSSKSQVYSVNADAEKYVNLKLLAGSLTPGVNEFTFVVAKGMDVIFEQYYSVLVKQVSVTVLADNYEINATTKSTVYKVTVMNVGNSADTFGLSVQGLDSSLYTLSSTSFFLPAGGAKEVQMTITMPEDLTKASGEVNGFSIAVSSGVYDYVDNSKITAVRIPVLHDTQLPVANVVNDLAGYVDITFTLKNTGNIRETYTINIEGADGLVSVIYVNAVGVTAESNNTISLNKGASVQVTVRISKTKDGLFYPKVNVLDSAGNIVNSVSPTIAVGFMFVNLWWIILVGASLVIGVVLTTVAVNRRKEARLMTASERAEAKPSIFKKMSDSMSGVKARVDEKRHEREMLNAAKSDVVAPASTAAEDDGWTKAPSKLDGIKEKLEERKKEKEDQKRKDDAFWEN